MGGGAAGAPHAAGWNLDQRHHRAGHPAEIGRREVGPASGQPAAQPLEGAGLGFDQGPHLGGDRLDVEVGQPGTDHAS